MSQTKNKNTFFLSAFIENTELNIILVTIRVPQTKNTYIYSFSLTYLYFYTLVEIFKYLLILKKTKHIEK